MDKGIIDSNPFLKVKVDTRRVLRAEHKKPDLTQVYTRDELDGLHVLAWKDFYDRRHPVHQLTPLAVMFMFLTGLRIGEVCGVRYEDINGNKIMIRRMVRYPSGEIVDHTKGTFGDREVPLVPQAKTLIETARRRQEAEGASTEGFIFSMNEKPVLYSSVAKAFYTYCRKMKISPKSSHKARKTFVSTLLDADVNLNSVREYVGHTDERTTLRNYCFDRSTEEEKLAKLTSALSM